MRTVTMHIKNLSGEAIVDSEEPERRGFRVSFIFPVEEVPEFERSFQAGKKPEIELAGHIVKGTVSQSEVSPIPGCDDWMKASLIMRNCDTAAVPIQEISEARKESLAVRAALKAITKPVDNTPEGRGFIEMACIENLGLEESFDVDVSYYVKMNEMTGMGLAINRCGAEIEVFIDRFAKQLIEGEA